jgi:hypothetical protein
MEEYKVTYEDLQQEFIFLNKINEYHSKARSLVKYVWIVVMILNYTVVYVANYLDLDKSLMSAYIAIIVMTLVYVIVTTLSKAVIKKCVFRYVNMVRTFEGE